MVILDGSSLTTADVARVLFDFEEAAASEESMERVKKQSGSGADCPRRKDDIRHYHRIWQVQ